MTSDSDVVAAALTLPKDERANLAYKLILSLDEPLDDPEIVKAEWNAEIRRRVQEIKSGAVVGIPYEEVRRQFQR